VAERDQAIREPAAHACATRKDAYEIRRRGFDVLSTGENLFNFNTKMTAGQV
jgi:hypothetical protein